MACEVTMGSHRMYSKFKGIPVGLKRCIGAAALIALSTSVMAAETKPNTQAATPQQIAAIGNKFRVEMAVMSQALIEVNKPGWVVPVELIRRGFVSKHE